MKSVLISIQPYWVFLIIAKKMGWEIDQEKTVEVRKGFPKDLNWNKKSIIYCGKNRQSFNRIPKKYQPLMEKFLGKVIGEFVCDKVYDLKFVPKEYYGKPSGTFEQFVCENSCLSFEDIKAYGKGKSVYAWHISDLVIYDKPRELSEFQPICKYNMDSECVYWDDCKHKAITTDWGYPANMCNKKITRPPQSYMFIELGV